MAESAAYARRGFKGGAKSSTIPAGISDTATSFAAADLSTWAGSTTNGPITVKIDGGLSTEEIVEIATIAGNNATGVERGRDGTTAVAHDPNCKIQHVSRARDFDEANRLVSAILGISGLAAGDLIEVLSATTFGRIAKGTARQALLMDAAATGHTYGASLASLLTASGDIIYASAANTPARLAKATDLQVLTLIGGLPAWVTPVTFVRKTATESVTSSTVQQNDDHLLFPIGANESWVFQMFLTYDGDAAGDLTGAVVVPAGATLNAQLIGPHKTATFTGTANASPIVQQSGFSGGALFTLGANGAGVSLLAQLSGIVRNGGTAGNVQLQWAQDVSSVVATRMFLDSYLLAWRVA